MAYLTHLEATADGSRHRADRLQTHHGGRPLVARYDLAAVRQAVTREEVQRRAPDLWRYQELLPVREPEHRATLGEGMTPLLPCPRLGAALGVPRLLVKDESQLPTGSFKARGMAVAVSRAVELGVEHVAAPTAGNAGGALAAYAARAGIACTVILPADTPVVNKLEAVWHGARVFELDGLIHDCGRIVAEGVERVGWFDLSTMKEPYRLEGKKTMGLELAEQLEWSLPDAVFYPTGGGTGLIGMWKAFDELAGLGWLESAHRPRMFACQSDACDPIAAAFRTGSDRGAEVVHPRTVASGLRVPKAFADFMILDAVRASGGAARATPEADIPRFMKQAMSLEGIALCPETAVCLDALQRCVREGTVSPEETVVVFNTGAAQKYVEVMDVELPRLHQSALDWSSLSK